MAVTVTELGYGSFHLDNLCYLELTQAVPSQGRIVVVTARAANNTVALSDSRSNTYRADGGAAAFTGGGVVVYSAQVVTALQVGDRISLSAGDSLTSPGSLMFWVLYCPELDSSATFAVLEDSANSADFFDLDYATSLSLGAGTRDRLIIGAVEAANHTFDNGTSTWPGDPSDPATSILETDWTQPAQPLSLYDAASTGLTLNYISTAVALGYQVAPPAAATWTITGLPDTDSFSGNSAQETRTRGEVILVYQAVVPPPVTDVSQARDYGTGRLLVAHVDASGAVRASRYNSNLPPTVAATVTLETSGGAGVSLIARGSNRFDLYYAQSSNIKRRSTLDGGRTWSVATTIANGYQDVAHVVDPGRKIELVALWKESENRWYLVVGTLQADDTFGAHSTPVTLVSSAKRGGSLLREPNGHFSFAYRTTSDTLTVVRCSAISKTGTGSWT